MKHSKLSTLFVLIIIFLSVNSIFAQKLKAEDILVKHLESIGTAEARSGVKNQVVVGDASIKFITQKMPPILGRIVMASAGEKNFWGMSTNTANYPSERFSFDGNKAKVGFVINGTRSILGNFVLSNDLLLEEGLLSGTLSNSWALLNANGRKAKLSYEGTKKINNKNAHILRYSPKGGGDVAITLFFDNETFQHIRSEYKRTSSAGIGLSPEQSSGFSESRLIFTEDFSEFKTEKGLTLPHNYRMLYSISGQNGTTEIEWNFKITDFAFNQNLAANTFDIENN